MGQVPFSSYTLSVLHVIKTRISLLVINQVYGLSQQVGQTKLCERREGGDSRNHVRKGGEVTGEIMREKGGRETKLCERRDRRRGQAKLCERWGDRRQAKLGERREGDRRNYVREGREDRQN